MSYEALNSKIMEMQDEMLEALQRNMRINSEKGEAKPGAPYGEGPKAALDDVLALGEKLGFKTGNADNRVGWIEYGEGEEMVGILGHLDVVPEGEGWEHPAYGAEIIDGELWGRGCLDDKGPVIGAIYALKAIRDLNLPIDRRIRILFGTDEECGSSCVEYYVNNGYEMPTIGITPDGEFPAIFFEKGISNFVVGKNSVEPGEIEVESFAGGTAGNVVTPFCRLVVKGALKVTPADGIVVKEEDGRTIVEATGKSAHGSTPQLGENAAIKLVNAVKENHFGGDFQKLIDFLAEKINTEVHGETLGVHYVDEETGETSVNLGVIDCDKEHLSITLDIRYPNNGEAEVVDAQIAKVTGEYGLEILNNGHGKKVYVPKDSELITKLVKVYEEQTGEKLEPLAIGGGTYAKEFPNMVAFGPTFPGQDAMIHQPNERVSIELLMKAICITGVAMYELAQK